MDYEKYYKLGNDRTYTIHFANKKGHSVDEIKKLFSAYGNVLSVNVSGNINGLRFVKYKTLHETMCCMKALEDSKVIRLLPEKDKMNNTSKNIDQRNLDQQATNTENSPYRIPNTVMQLDGSLILDKRSLDEERTTYNGAKLDWDKRSGNNDSFSDTNSQVSRYNYKSKKDTFEDNTLISAVSNRKHSLSTCQTFGNGNDDNIPALISDLHVNNKEFDAIIDCSSRESIKGGISKVMIIPMQEIIVANIHINYGVHYILHLFEKYNPISATLVNVIPETNIRYCHVYFKTLQDTVAVEEEFDNFTLSEKNLIVLRTSQLTEA